MSVSRQQLAEAIGKRTLKVSNSKKLANQVAAYLLETNQTASLESLLRDVIAYRAEHGVVEAKTVSAHELSAEVKAQVRAILKDEYPNLKASLLDSEIDPAVIGGVRIELPGEQLDATVAAKLNLFKKLTAEENA